MIEPIENRPFVVRLVLKRIKDGEYVDMETYIAAVKSTPESFPINTLVDYNNIPIIIHHTYKHKERIIYNNKSIDLSNAWNNNHELFTLTDKSQFNTTLSTIILKYNTQLINNLILHYEQYNINPYA